MSKTSEQLIDKSKELATTTITAVGDQINTSMDESFAGKKHTGSISYCHSTK